MSEERGKLQVIITSGAEDPHKARQGLEVALTAVAMDVDVTVFLTLRGAFWVEKRPSNACVIPGCESIPALLSDLIAAGAKIECCSTCAHHFAGSCQSGNPTIEGVVLSGMASLVSRTVQGVPTISF